MFIHGMILHHPYGYGSIPIHTIFSGMNIHESQLFWCSPGTHCHMFSRGSSHASTLPGDLQFLRCRDPQTSGTSGHWKDSLGPTLKIRPEVRHQVLQLWYLHVSTIPLSTTVLKRSSFLIRPYFEDLLVSPRRWAKRMSAMAGAFGCETEPLGDKGTTRSVSARTFFANRVGWWWIMIETKARLPSSI